MSQCSILIFILILQFRPRCTVRTFNPALAGGLGAPYSCECMQGYYKYKTLRLLKYFGFKPHDIEGLILFLPEGQADEAWEPIRIAGRTREKSTLALVLVSQGHGCHKVT
jgi:hypothetical protein